MLWRSSSRCGRGWSSWGRVGRARCWSSRATIDFARKTLLCFFSFFFEFSALVLASAVSSDFFFLVLPVLHVFALFCERCAFRPGALILPLARLSFPSSFSLSGSEHHSVRVASPHSSSRGLKPLFPFFFLSRLSILGSGFKWEGTEDLNM